MPYKNPDEQREYQRLWMARRRSEAIKAFGGQCVRCGSVKELEFAHKNRTLKDRPYKGTGQAVNWSWSPDRITAELAKCELLCSECHKVDTRKEIEALFPIVHGTLAGYKRDAGCRCEPCRKANADYQRYRRQQVYSLEAVG